MAEPEMTSVLRRGRRNGGGSILAAVAALILLIAVLFYAFGGGLSDRGDDVAHAEADIALKTS